MNCIPSAVEREGGASKWQDSSNKLYGVKCQNKHTGLMWAEVMVCVLRNGRQRSGLWFVRVLFVVVVCVSVVCGCGLCECSLWLWFVRVFFVVVVCASVLCGCGL